jgi:ATP-dependent Clp protease protease subunit
MTHPSEHFNEAGSPQAYGMPMVVEQTPGGERGYDLMSRLMKDNAVMLHGPVNSAMAGIIVAQLLYLGAQSAGTHKPITMYVDSPGGSVNAGMSIYDTMNYVQAEYGVPIRTIGMGMNMSMGSFLLCAGTPGYRSMLPNADHMVHQPSAGSGGKVSDMGITQDCVEEVKQRLAMLYVAHSKMTYEEVRQLSDRDSFLRAEECVKLGLVDKIMYADEILARKLATGSVTYPDGMKEHLERISKIQREANLIHAQTRPGADKDRGPYKALIAGLDQKPA